VIGPTDLVQQLVDRWLSGARESALGFLAPDCAFSMLRSEPFRGLAALKTFLEGLSPEDQTATVTPLSFLGRRDKVVMLGQVAFARGAGERGYTEHQAFAWVFTVRGEKVASVAVFPSWDDAKADAGISGAEAPEVERHRPSPHRFMRALRPGEAPA